MPTDEEALIWASRRLVQGGDLSDCQDPPFAMVTAVLAVGLVLHSGSQLFLRLEVGV